VAAVGVAAESAFEMIDGCEDEVGSLVIEIFG
jgi:hypothetical protein